MFSKAYFHLFLFVVTFITTTYAGAEWIYGKSFYYNSSEMGISQFFDGLQFSIPFLLFLSAHEFGHYFTARFKKIDVSLPYYLPSCFLIFTTIGTFGAFIKIRSRLYRKEDYFDIGISGPLVGFVVALGILIVGFLTLPDKEFIYSIHPEYQLYGSDYQDFLYTNVHDSEAMVLGKSMIYSFLEKELADPARIPHPFETTHYPLLLAGFLGLLFTALNLLPIGQLDGGHILYALVGSKAFNILSPLFLTLLVFYSGLGLFRWFEFWIDNQPYTFYIKVGLYLCFLYLCFSRIFQKKWKNTALAFIVFGIQLAVSQLFVDIRGYEGFLFFGFLLGRVIGVHHPLTYDRIPLSFRRKIWGWIAIIIFVLCFSFNPVIGYFF